jgi:hypothetical protein
VAIILAIRLKPKLGICILKSVLYYEELDCGG